MLERFTERARQVLVFADQEAALLDHNFVGTEHLLLGLVREGEGLAGKALATLGVTLDRAREQVRGIIGPSGEPASDKRPFTPRAKKVLELSLREALQLGHNYIGTEHILLALVREGEGVAAQLLRKLDGGVARVRHEVINLLAGSAERSEAGAGPAVSPPGTAAQRQTKPPFPPRCQHCEADLEAHTRARRINVPDDAGGPTVPTTVIYCGSCGRGLVARVDPDSPPSPAD